jgi:hypothetical protein
MANNPRGCAEIDLTICPWKIKLMEWPMPQPGQKSIPSNLKMQNEKCPSAAGFMIASITLAVIQNTSSVYLNRIILLK